MPILRRRRLRILYIKTTNSSFVQLDQKILETNFETDTFFINRKTRTNYIYSVVKLVIYLIVNVFRYNVYFTRFADYHTAIMVFFGRLFNINSIIVVGGYDVKYIPEFKYGAYSNVVRTKYSLNNVTYLLPNNSTLILDRNTYSFSNPRTFGIKQFAPNTKAHIQVIHNGYNIKFWTDHSGNNDKKKINVLTVAFVNNLRSYKIKGIDDYIKAAEKLSEFTFTIIGFPLKTAQKLGIKLPKNLNLVSKVTQEELKSYYYNSKVFCLLSLTEGMPNVLCEAMLCKCIPVGSNVNSIPEIIDNTGYVINKKNIDEIVMKIKLALDSDDSFADLAQKRITKNYSLDRRQSEVVALIKSIEIIIK